VKKYFELAIIDLKRYYYIFILFSMLYCIAVECRIYLSKLPLNEKMEMFVRHIGLIGVVLFSAIYIVEYNTNMPELINSKMNGLKEIYLVRMSMAFISIVGILSVYVFYMFQRVDRISLICSTGEMFAYTIFWGGMTFLIYMFFKNIYIGYMIPIVLFFMSLHIGNQIGNNLFEISLFGISIKGVAFLLLGLGFCRLAISKSNCSY